MHGQPVRRLLVVLPTWLGDCVMAMPTLRALRAAHPSAHITALVGRALKPMVTPNPWTDRVVSHKLGKAGGRHGMRRLAARLRAARFDTAVLLPNSFRSALLVWWAGVPRRAGYGRDGRTWLLTDPLLPRREAGRFVTVPTREYYLGLARYMGAAAPDASMQLFTDEHDETAADAVLHKAGYDPSDWPGRDRPLVLLNPGANFGDAKMWPPTRYAAVADRLTRELDAVVAVSGSPTERWILDRVIGEAQVRVLDLPAAGLTLRTLKVIVRRAALMITNDTGPRHIAAAMGTPVVTIFGPTDPRWTTLGFAKERGVTAGVPCQPCQKKQCPLAGTDDELICQRNISVDMVEAEAKALLSSSSSSSAMAGESA